MVTVAGRWTQHEDDTIPRLSLLSEEQYGAIVDEARRLANDLSARPGRTVGAVQGLLLLSEWCFPYARQKDDRSFHFINLVRSAWTTRVN